MTDIEELAGKLTLGEHNGLLHTKPGASYAYREMHGIPRVSLFSKGLLRKLQPCAEYRYELTPLGLSLRTYLQEQGG